MPYFPFTSDRGSTCKNTLTGYACSPLTLADVEYFGDIDLPDDIGCGRDLPRHPRLPDGRGDRVPPASAAQH